MRSENAMDRYMAPPWFHRSSQHYQWWYCWICRKRNPSHNKWQPVPITANCILMDLPFQWGVITIYPIPYTHFLFDHGCVSSSHLIHVTCLCLVLTGMLIGIMLKCFVAFCYGEVLFDLTLIHQDHFTGTWQSCYWSWILWSNQLCESTADDHKKKQSKTNKIHISQNLLYITIIIVVTYVSQSRSHNLQSGLISIKM